MAREIYAYRDGKLTPVSAPEKIQTHEIIDDEMPAIQHPASGQYISSKKKFSEVTKAYGLTEVGNESLDNIKPEIDPSETDEAYEEDALKAYAACTYGEARVSNEEEKELCQEKDRIRIWKELNS